MKALILEVLFAMGRLAKRRRATNETDGNVHTQRRKMMVAVVILAIVAISLRFIFWDSVREPNTPSATNDLSVWQARFASARHFNASDVTFKADESFTAYIGTQACRRCHAQQYDTYSQTLHSKSFKDTHASSEPSGDRFHHAASSRLYESYHIGDEVRHREELIGANDEKIAVIDIPMKYTVGSGEHAHSYLYESEGFLFQSPITWYREIDGWKMSPGYEDSGHSSFTRVVAENCLFCHVGMIERSADNYARFRVVEQEIGCERCHGPGRSHAEIHRKADSKSTLGDNFSGSVPNTAADMVDHIVHPAKLSRGKSEAVCQQCHLQGTVYVTAPGTSMWDFRPGQSLLEVRADYQVAGQDESKIVGHVEQLHQSACYLGSDTLTCITCHDPHHNVPRPNRAAFFRDLCLNCHSDNDCGLNQADRRREHDNCAVCHMPKLPTNVRHAALHHHRIGIHEPTDQSTISEGVESQRHLEPILDDQFLGDKERTRRKWLALGKYLYWTGDDARIDSQLRDATRTLIASLDIKSMDADSKLIFAGEAYRAGKVQAAAKLATQVLDASQPGSANAIESRSILTMIAYHQGRRDIALKHYRELARQRVNSTDLYFLALCELDAGNIDNAVRALEKSLLIKPDDIPAHKVLCDIFSVAQRQRAGEHRRVILALTNLQQ